MRIAQQQRAIAEAFPCGVGVDAVALEARRPPVETAGRDGQRDLGRQAVAAPRRRHLVPGEEGQIAPRMTGGVGVEEVVGAGVVLVDALLHQPHAEHAGVEVEILLRRAGDGGDVVEALDRSRIAHGVPLAETYRKNS
jgi:hypothetical protein